MDHYLRIQNAIDFIEENLFGSLNIVEISQRANYSAFHFQRVFQAILGYSVSEYIRLRRLSEASSQIKNSKKSILEVALDVDYQSHEAFTRAFKKQFGITPMKYRNSATEINNTVHPLNLHKDCADFEKIEILKKPTIIHQESFSVVGVEYKTSLEDLKYFHDIPDFYNDFGLNEYYSKIENRLAPAFAYGINFCYQNDGSFSFLVGEKVNCVSSNEKSKLISIEIPSGKYAMFKASGSVESVQATWRYIYSTWLTNSNYERAEGPDFEITDVCNSVHPNDYKIEVYIPIK